MQLSSEWLWKHWTILMVCLCITLSEHSLEHVLYSTLRENMPWLQQMLPYLQPWCFASQFSILIKHKIKNSILTEVSIWEGEGKLDEININSRYVAEWVAESLNTSSYWTVITMDRLWDYLLLCTDMLKTSHPSYIVRRPRLKETQNDYKWHTVYSFSVILYRCHCFCFLCLFASACGGFAPLYGHLASLCVMLCLFVVVLLFFLVFCISLWLFGVLSHAVWLSEKHFSLYTLTS